MNKLKKQPFERATVHRSLTKLIEETKKKPFKSKFIEKKNIHRKFIKFDEYIKKHLSTEVL